MSEKVERILARFLLSLDKALTRPEILLYLKEQILRNTHYGMDKITEDEIDRFLRRLD